MRVPLFMRVYVKSVVRKLALANIPIKMRYQYFFFGELLQELRN